LWALCSPRTRFPTPAREESVRLRAFRTPLYYPDSDLENETAAST
jgi:hypothetical protein